MKLAIIGGGQLGCQLFDAAFGAQRLLIDTRDNCPAHFVAAELGYSQILTDAASCDVVALAVPPGICQSILDTICPVMSAGSIILNFPTKYLIPQSLREAFPALHLMESKLLGSAVGLSKGLDHLVLLSQAEETVVERVRQCLPGLKLAVGDYRLVPEINRFGMKVALTAAIQLENALRERGCDETLLRPAVGGLMAGSIISYAADTLGEFGLELVEELRREAGATR